MIPDRRHDEIIKMLTQRGSLTLKEVVDELGVSEATARRDINRLAEAGRLVRAYGGAVIKGPAEVPFTYSDSTDRDEKQRIAQAAAELVSDSDTVVLDIGSTVLELSRLLAGRPITVITSNLAVFEVMKGADRTELILLGGQFRRNYLSTVGFLAENAMRQLHADIAFLGTSGITKAGRVLDTTPVEVSVKQQMIESSERVVLLATQRKFPGTGLRVVCGPDRVSTLITSAGTPDDYLLEFRRSGTAVMKVS
ncbi:ArsR family transcriptional regulator [Sinomonas atrocyanea]|uniref:Lactose phosphotransferase system repressor n=1 Tax=Sinomonas atrocyanea TaxID=37927 RepID=A0A126ZWL5_9MICC|nr:DeoR/GlpR family DNA-binding transcription regulator [Sinomonas atrocyanea]AMM31568.1 ArsR family transcriptional regulator [Sinomonas atrocyanea]GEB66350.1 DeoR family transcriptional regulator [Sinomonas atrocyanea]GGG70134.1 DeoR family transcriptional regulator [Sinomonas atrocyanea]